MSRYGIRGRTTGSPDAFSQEGRSAERILAKSVMIWMMMVWSQSAHADQQIVLGLLRTRAAGLDFLY